MLEIVTIDEAVFLRSALSGEGAVGCAGVSFGVSFGADDVFRESHENGLVMLLLMGGGADETGGGGGGGGAAHGTEGRAPDRPCNEGFEDLGGRTGFGTSEAANHVRLF